jgi:predicted small integral membrane protein
MKYCNTCGTLQENHQKNCIKCGGRLGEPMSKEEETRKKQLITEALYKNRYFQVSKLDVVISILLFLGAIGYIIAITTGQPQFLVVKLLPTTLMIIIMIMEGIKLINPKIAWKLYTLRSAFQTSNTDVRPTDTTLSTRRVVSYMVLALGYVLYIIAWFI